MKVSAVRKPLEVEAIMYDSHNKDELEGFVGEYLTETSYEKLNYTSLVVETLSGSIPVEVGDYVVKYVSTGEITVMHRNQFNNEFNITSKELVLND